MSMELRQQQAPESTSAEAQTAEAAPATTPSETPLEDAIVRVRRDSQKDNRRYLDETTVPNGGE